ncbi:hypothetical protein [Furfurilactobacillus milii]|uniref:Uncharacterized protein n=1 Tax=Furfurilactobacillus milii TaxID=2888272 RepID=A0ABT6D7Y1_9LACO|nr:hypothetical protein [Furfurilactobacillus milii]QLE65805.1 hypothetical protein LROSL2_0452 [Furfurilactobacillus rossiae]MCF6160284.1 hypothetical protein [Furfurilactobacillus milii]MCF6162227.1 hypothetical protein [Furfurilactobacillus milii]MCF6420430.1 hypothetical protein [Furfurilactobacillus milii]MDF9913246.1 hypothetical protein [Furfurilactobacillus milii]
MSKFVENFDADNEYLTIPDGFKEVAHDTRSRNGEDVEVVRYQQSEKIVQNNPHVTVVYGDDGRLISYNNFSVDSPDALPDDSEAVDIALNVFDSLDSEYAEELSLMRIDEQERLFINDDGDEIATPILWVKFAHMNGSYNWVSVGPAGQVIEFERESLWDYGQSRRATEEWNDDDWVAAREHRGPQLSAPSALA